MNAYRPARREDYIPIIQGIIPFCDGEELRLRTGLLLMRDRAIATKASACASSWALLDVVEKEASEVAFRTIPIDDLREFRRLCVMCVANASGWDMLYQPRIPGLGEGEANAGG